MTLAVVRSLDWPRQLRTGTELDDFEQELVDQYALAAASSGAGDGSIAGDRSVIFGFSRFMGRHLWTASTDDADRFLAHQRKVLRLSGTTVRQKALALARFYEFLLIRYQGDIQALTGHVVAQPIDEFNRPATDRLRSNQTHPALRRRDRGVLCGLAGLAAERTQVPAGGPGLPRRLAVAPSGPANRRDAHARPA